MRKFFFILFLIPALVFAQETDLNDQFLKVEAALQKDPANVELKMAQAFLFTQGLEFDRAVEIYASVLQQEPKNERAATELCYLYTQLQQKEQAFPVCELVVSLHPESSLAHDNLGLSYFKMGDYVASLPHFVKALSLAKDSVLIRYHLAQNYLALKEFQVARDFLQKSFVYGSHPDDRFLIYHGLYLAHAGLKNRDQAFTAIYEAYKLSGNGLFLGKVILAAIKAHSLSVFLLVSGILLWFCHYLGQRLNRFLKNDLSDLNLPDRSV